MMVNVVCALSHLLELSLCYSLLLAVPVRSPHNPLHLKLSEPQGMRDIYYSKNKQGWRLTSLRSSAANLAVSERTLADSFVSGRSDTAGEASVAKL